MPRLKRHAPLSRGDPMNNKLKNISASIHARLLNISRGQNMDFNRFIIRYAIERLLFRISRSRHSSRFVLKGAMLFTLWSDSPHRDTQDLDLLGFGDSSLSAMSATFVELCTIECEDDGMLFDANSVKSEEIKALDEYVGIRVTLIARLGNARIPLQIDIGIGDAVVPPAEETDYPSILGLPAPRLRAYRPETVIAEKLHAMVSHAMLNTRMKDYFDLYHFARHFFFNRAMLVDAIEATFKRQGTNLPRELPIGLTSSFAEDPIKQTQWSAFARKISASKQVPSLVEAVETIAIFIAPVLDLESRVTTWTPPGPWS